MKHLLPCSLLILAGLVLAACDASVYGGNPNIDAANARATQEMAQAYIRSTEQAAARIAHEATAQAMQTRQASEAEIALLNAQATATASAWEIEQAHATATANAIMAEATGRAVETAQAATATAASIQTATAWPPTATAAAFIQQEEARKAQRRAVADWVSMITTPLWVLFPLVLAVLAVIGLVAFIRVVIPAWELRMRMVRRGPYGAPVYMHETTDAQGRKVLVAYNSDRNFGPGAVIDGNGGVTSTGHAPTPQLQAQVTGQDQLVDLVRAMPSGKEERKQAQTLAARFVPQALPAGQPVQIEIIQPDDNTVDGWVQDVQYKLLTEGEDKP